MNWQHLQTFIWLRWRLRINQRKRAGAASIVIQRILAVCAALAATTMFVIALALGLLVLPSASAPVLMLVWDGIIVVFLFLWTIELMAELQRSELLSVEKFLHLPVSATGVFLINYVGSIFSPSFSMILLLPAMIGISIALVFSKGPLMLLLFPLVAGFILMVTAITYQFRGWLSSLMINKRRRRMIISFGTLAFMLITQLPNLLNMTGWFSHSNLEARTHMREEITKLDRSLAAGRISSGQYRQGSEAIKRKYQGATESLGLQEVERIATIANTLLPAGWLPYGAMASAQGKVVPSLLGVLGMALIGAASLQRSYRTTLRLYTGQFSFGKRRPVTIEVPRNAAGSNREAVQSSTALLEKQLPWLSEQASAVALAGFRSLTRAPEAKILLVSPVIMLAVFGGMFLRQDGNPPEFIRPLVASGAFTMILFFILQLAGNQFGFDRSGFRTFVLASASRTDILLGKNLSLAPFALGLGTFAVTLLQFVQPMRADHFLAALTQMVSMYLVFCLLANLLSMFAPMPVASGSLRPASPKGMMILVHLLFFFLLPAAMTPILIPLGIEFALSWSWRLTWLPVYLLLSLVEFAVVARLYSRVLSWQGKMLQSREQRILEIVTAKIE